MKKLLTVISLISAIIPSAYAISPKPPITNYKAFNGFNLGVGGAYYLADFHASINSGNGFQGDDNLQANGGYFHGQAGYGHAFNQFYLGFNIFADLGQAEETDKITAVVNQQNISKKINSSLNNVYGLVLTPGVAAAPNLLIYGLSGFVLGGQDLTVDGENLISNGHKPGWTAGAGAEYMFQSAMTLSAEWSYISFDEASELAIFGGPYDTQKVHANRFIVGLKYYI